MTVETENSYTGPYTTNGLTTAFPFDFDTVAVSDVSVILVDADGTETVASGYSVSRTDGGGTVTFDTAPATGYSLFVVLEPSFSQSTDFTQGGTYLASAHNAALDRSALRSIRNRRDADRAVKAPLGEAPLNLPAAQSRRSKLMGFEGEGAIALYGVRDVMTEIGVTIYDDGNWAVDGETFEDGAWG